MNMCEYRCKHILYKYKKQACMATHDLKAYIFIYF